MARIDPATRKTWKENPGQSVSLILQVTGDMAKRTDALEKRGCRVRRTLRLTNSISVRCKAETALGLSRLSWIKKIEVDRPLGGLFGR